jgi:hypothetical protein
MHTNVFGVEGLEGAIVRLMEQDQDSHNLTQCQLARTVTLLGATCQALLMPEWFEGSAKVIDIAKEFEYTHD